MSRRPNFVFILADDLGYADLGCYGARRSTPALDRMAAEGLLFTDGYANSALCSPSRFALATGRYQYRLRGAAEEPLPPSARGRSDLGLPPSHPTLASLLRDAGYATALIGKWHLGYPPHFGPRQSGYEEFFGPLGGGIDYFRHIDITDAHDFYENEAEARVSGYATDLFTERALDYVRRMHAADRPFLLSLHYTAPHWPWETRSDEGESRRIGCLLYHLDGGSVEIYERMIAHMDEGIGRLLDTLDLLGLGGHTLVVFTSDNGGERFSNVWPLVGRKMDLLEGGIRVPLLARWPTVIPPGTRTSQVATTMDWLPTMLEASGVRPHPEYPPDGMSLLHVFGHPCETRSRELFWRMNYRSQRAARIGDWKYLAQDQHEYLFDLAADARERANLAHRFPERLANLRACFEAWNASMPSVPPDAYVGRVLSAAEMARPTP